MRTSKFYGVVSTLSLLSFSIRTGVYRQVSGERVGGHAMKLIGWGTQGGTDYWLIANSWGTQWGNGGFLKFLRGVNHLGIEDYLVTALPRPDNSLSLAGAVSGASGPVIFACDATTKPKCEGKYGYAVHPVDVCTDEWCYCGWNEPELVQCEDGQSFDANPSVYACADTSHVPACMNTNSWFISSCENSYHMHSRHNCMTQQKYISLLEESIIWAVTSTWAVDYQKFVSLKTQCCVLIIAVNRHCTVIRSNCFPCRYVKFGTWVLHYGTLLGSMESGGERCRRW